MLKVYLKKCINYKNKVHVIDDALKKKQNIFKTTFYSVKWSDYGLFSLRFSESKKKKSTDFHKIKTY